MKSDLQGKQVIYVVTYGPTVQFAVHLDASILLREVYENGSSALQVFADIQENLYIVFIIGNNAWDFLKTQEIVMQTIELWVNEVGIENIENCKAPIEWLDDMKHVYDEE